MPPGGGLEDLNDPASLASVEGEEQLAQAIALKRLQRASQTMATRPQVKPTRIIASRQPAPEHDRSGS